MFERHSEAIFELLRDESGADSAQLSDLWQQCQLSGRSLADYVISHGLMTRPALLARIAGRLGCEFVPDPPAALTVEVARLLPEVLARSRGVVPLGCTGGTLDLLVADPFDRQLGSELTFALGQDVRLLVGDPSRVEMLINDHYGDTTAGRKEVPRERGAADSGDSDAEPTAHDLEAMAGQGPVIRLVNQVLAQAIRARASDVHFEPFEDEFKIRYRVDGTLLEMTSPSKEMALPVASRIKVLADLNIAERRMPQDGRIKLTLEGRPVDLRVSTLPTQFGESIVLRVLDQSAVQLDLAALGMPGDVLQGIQQVIRRPHGILLVTGPTGSGKTTTLYGALRAINTPDLKLLTIEDPVEYEIEGLMQVPVNPAAGLTFASALRSFLRQDPDVIMVGEIRDLETAQIAVQASLTGHLVMSTLHTNDAPAAITRLLDMGVEPFLLASTLQGILAQRLVRRICPHCRIADEPGRAILEQLGLDNDDLRGRQVFRGRGCDQCGQTGYRGRHGIFEWLVLTESVRELVAQGAPAARIRQEAEKDGMRSLRDDGLRAVWEGITTLEELGRYI